MDAKGVITGWAVDLGKGADSGSLANLLGASVYVGTEVILPDNAVDFLPLLGAGMKMVTRGSERLVVDAAGNTVGKLANGAKGVGELTVAEQATGGQIINVNPADLRWTQRTAGGNGRADYLRQSISENGYAGSPIDVIQTTDGIVTVDHTRAAVALEQGITSIPAALHLPTDSLPANMLGRFGSATTWGEAAAYRAANQRPPLPPTGTTVPPQLPAKK